MTTLACKLTACSKVVARCYTERMASEHGGGGGTDAMTFLLLLVIVGALIQAGYSQISKIIAQPEPAAQIEMATTTADVMTE